MSRDGCRDESPVVSVVIPCRNSGFWIDETISSVVSQRGVTVELIVVDDGSTDRSSEVAEAAAARANSPIRIIQQPHRGASRARNIGTEASGGDYIHSASQPLLFDRLSLTIPPGAKIGLVGRYGGGKTTLTRLLLRFSDVEAGEILVGGQAIDRVLQAALREAIGYVPQDPSMFHRRIADNIRVGRPGATDARVRRAA